MKGLTSHRRIGIDVGGTNTDAVLLDSTGVVAALKTPTTEDVTGGIRTALALLLDRSGVAGGEIDAVMIGTTHFTNAVIERRGLMKVGALRIGLPASAALPPFVDWPEDLAELVRGDVIMVEGGHEYDGRRIVPFDGAAVREAARRFRDRGLTSIGISSIFSPLTAEDELAAAEILKDEIPEIRLTLSHELGRIGLLERENVTLLNAALQDLARRTTRAFAQALAESGIRATLCLTQNDGTIMQAGMAEQFPVYCFASGPTNSMRGAAFLSGIADGAVIDIGGTTSDVGFLRHGFPREANNVVEIGGVRTMFRMPDLLSLGLGGGTMVATEPLKVGPSSVGYRLTEKALVFGGDQLTMTDIAVAAGRTEIGDPGRVRHLPEGLVRDALARAHAMVEEGVDRMKTEAGDVPLIAVGGGSFLVPERVAGCSEAVQVEHHSVANAVGAAIAQVSGEVDQIFSGVERDAALDQARLQAEERAVTAGADPATLKTVEVEDLPLAYLPGNALRVRLKVIGDIASGTHAATPSGRS